MSRYFWLGLDMDLDVETIRRWYATGPVWDCSCGHCRNFVALAREGRLPTDVCVFLEDLGIPLEKATYVCELYHEGEHLLYQVFYRLAGRLPPDTAQRKTTSWGSVELANSLEPSTAEDFPPPWFDLELDLWLPWVLDEPIDGNPMEPSQET